MLTIYCGNTRGQWLHLWGLSTSQHTFFQFTHLACGQLAGLILNKYLWHKNRPSKWRVGGRRCFSCYLLHQLFPYPRRTQVTFKQLWQEIKNVHQIWESKYHGMVEVGRDLERSYGSKKTESAVFVTAAGLAASVSSLKAFPRYLHRSAALCISYKLACSH